MKNFPPVRFIVPSVALIVVAALTPMKFTCPICDGEGTLTAAQGLVLESSSLNLLKQEHIYTFGECYLPLKMTKYTYAVNMTLSNKSDQAAKGTVKVVFQRQGNTAGGNWVQDAEGNMQWVPYMPPTVPAYVDIPSQTTKEVRVTLSFIDKPPAEGEGALENEIKPGEDVQDPTCGGLGTLTFANWLKARVVPPSFD